MNPLQTSLKIAGFLHFGILIASALTPKALDWRANLASLHPFLRKLFWVYGSFIVLVIISFGLLTLSHTAELARARPWPVRSACSSRHSGRRVCLCNSLSLTPGHS